MKKLTDLLVEFTLESIEKDFRKKLKLVEDFGHLISDDSTPTDIQIQEIDYDLKYLDDFNSVFHLNIRKIFSIKILILEKSERESLFERRLALKGKYHLKNIGNGEVEILSSSPYSKFGNTIRKYSKPEENTSQSEEEFMYFSIDEFLNL